MFKKIRKFVAIAILAVATIIPLSSCKGEFVDYASQAKIQTTNWRTGDFKTDGVGVATLRKSVDGDTAHFYVGATSYIIQGRFNGIDTPESTGVIELWGKAAARFTRETLEKAKTIVLETEPNNEEDGPETDSTGNRYLVWVWTSERPIEEEDGSQLRLLNLEIVQNGYSFSKGTAGSIYESYLLDADAQAQRHDLVIWSDDVDPDFYYGKAIISSLQEIFSHPEDYLGAKVYVEGYVTRTMGYNAYIQDEFEEEDGSMKNYGAYIFTMYKEYEILAKGNHIGVTGVVGTYNGSYQLTDVKYNPLQEIEDGMVNLGDTKIIEPEVISVEEALKGDRMGTLIRINNLRATGGYGGLDELDKNGNKNETNSMTIYVKDENNKEFNIRIDASTFIRDTNKKKIQTYKYFVNLSKEGVTFDFVGLMGRYISDYTDAEEIQLMLVATSDLFYHNLPEA